MHYYLSRKRNAGTVHIVSQVGTVPWSLCMREGPWPKGLFWWIVAGYPVCKQCRRRLKEILQEVERAKQARKRLRTGGKS